MSEQTITINSGFFDSVNGDRLYSADQMNMPYKRIVSDGVFATNSGTASDDFQVVSASDGMKIHVKAGEAIVGSKWFKNPITQEITVQANASANPRIDSIILQMNNSLSVRAGRIVYRTGEPALSPSAPDLSTDSDIVELRLANISVPVGLGYVTNAYITDLRGSASCPWVTGLIRQVDTSTLWNQYQAAYAAQFQKYTNDFDAYINIQREAWQEFISGLTEDLTVATNIAVLTDTYTASATVSSIPIGITGWNPTTDVLQVFINGVYADPADRYHLSNNNQNIILEEAIAAGSVVQIVCFKSLVTGEVDTILTMITALQEAIGSPLVASTVAQMTDHDKVYVYTGSETGYTAGNWYYWNGTAWTSGGVYNSTAVQTDTTLTQSGMAADAKAVGDRFDSFGLSSDIKTSLLQLASKVAYIDDGGEDYYQDLYDALYWNTWSVSNVLSHCVSSNRSDSVTKGSAYSATISASSGYTLTGATVSIIMDGVDITSTAYNNGSISIASVTGNLVITVTAEAKTLDSISAVYNQSGTVYDTDTLDSLKTDLVVTATYSDTSTATVPSTDYTLIGTLTVGTSTITVSYGGKTTTFTVTVSGLLPSGYNEYDYIAHNNDTGSAQAVDKMIKLAEYSNMNRIGIEFPVVSTRVQAGLAIIGARTSSGATTSFAFYSSNALTDGSFGYHLHGVDSALKPPFGINTIHNVKYVAATSSPTVLTVDGTDYNVNWNNDSTINAKFTLFSNPTSATSPNRISADIQLGRIIITNLNGEVISDYVPCMRTSDNQLGMYERINGVFYTTPTAGYATYGDASCEYSVGNWA